jgi:hypothetical protein
MSSEEASGPFEQTSHLRNEMDNLLGASANLSIVQNIIETRTLVLNGCGILAGE